ncbi:MAG: acyl carrier protein [Spirochaetes bacterium]|nr:acyl carrier protein [Spirochaetota bacterium]
MKREEVARRLINVMARELGKKRDQIKNEHHFAHDLGADSLKSIELVAAFEEEFDIEVNEEDALKVQTVVGAVDFFDKLLK